MWRQWGSSLYLNSPLPYVRRHIAVNNCVECVVKSIFYKLLLILLLLLLLVVVVVVVVIVVVVYRFSTYGCFIGVFYCVFLLCQGFQTNMGAASFFSHYLSGPSPYVRRHISFLH